jgi:hypothetical protein
LAVVALAQVVVLLVGGLIAQFLIAAQIITQQLVADVGVVKQVPQLHLLRVMAVAVAADVTHISQTEFPDSAQVSTVMVTCLYKTVYMDTVMATMVAEAVANQMELMVV